MRKKQQQQQPNDTIVGSMATCYLLNYTILYIYTILYENEKNREK